jgi:hypothetical protein
VARRQEEPLSEGRTGAHEDYARGVTGWEQRVRAGGSQKENEWLRPTKLREAGGACAVCAGRDGVR